MSRISREKTDGPLLHLDTWEDLDEYCYYVAGTIGIMLTRLFAEHSRHWYPRQERSPYTLEGLDASAVSPLGR